MVRDHDYVDVDLCALKHPKTLFPSLTLRTYVHEDSNMKFLKNTVSLAFCIFDHLTLTNTRKVKDMRSQRTLMMSRFEVLDAADAADAAVRAEASKLRNSFVSSG